MLALRPALTAAILLAATLRGAEPARTDAALAVGQPADVAAHGIAIGWAVDYPERKAAEEEALARCRGLREVPPAARTLCRVVASVRDTCLAVALDPDRGTTGIGWGVHRKRKRAENAAMDKCTGASARNRRKSCRVAFVRCDGR